MSAGKIIFNCIGLIIVISVIRIGFIQYKSANYVKKNYRDFYDNNIDFFWGSSGNTFKFLKQNNVYDENIAEYELESKRALKQTGYIVSFVIIIAIIFVSLQGAGIIR